MMEDLNSEIERVLKSAGIDRNPDNPRQVSPKSLEEFSRLFEESSRAGLKLRLRGMGTQSEASQDRLMVSTLGLDAVDRFIREDLILVVGAGMAYNRLAELTAEFGWEPETYAGTIGGCLSGQRDAKAHLELSSRILGLTYILPTGGVIELGSHSVKDVAGYRIAPMLFGAEGRLGMIARVTINLAAVSRDYSFVSNPSYSSSYARAGSERMIRELISAVDPGDIFAYNERL